LSTRKMGKITVSFLVLFVASVVKGNEIIFVEFTDLRKSSHITLVASILIFRQKLINKILFAISQVQTTNHHFCWELTERMVCFKI
jgi:hypothetical protein